MWGIPQFHLASCPTPTHSQIALTRTGSSSEGVFFGGLYSTDLQEHHRKAEVSRKKPRVIEEKYQKVLYQALSRGKIPCCLRTKFAWEKVCHGPPSKFEWRAC